MAMSMQGEVHLPANKEFVWEKLNDAAVLKRCIPGCQSLERVGDTGFAAVVKLKVGPVGATFKGSVELQDWIHRIPTLSRGKVKAGWRGSREGAHESHSCKSRMASAV
ncbi:MAG: carbon monoxide dehydrogenase [Hyphomicrobiales bacterium]|nr:carbon monoxide dehydrogenase [Hyphomicrobiales bacterium]